MGVRGADLVSSGENHPKTGVRIACGLAFTLPVLGQMMDAQKILMAGGAIACTLLLIIGSGTRNDDLAAALSIGSLAVPIPATLNAFTANSLADLQALATSGLFHNEVLW